MKEKSSEKLSFGVKVGYGVGDIFGGGAMVIVGLYYLYFLTDIVRITPALAGLVILISKMWDAVADPIMGTITDRTKSRFGRRRVYFLTGIPLVILSMFLMWHPVYFNLEGLRFAYILFTYVFFSSVLTMVMIPYYALSPELTPDYNERTSLSTVRMIISSISSLVCAVVPLEIVKLFRDVTVGYSVMAVAFGLFFALPYIAVLLTTKEKTEYMEREKVRLNLKELLLDPLKLKAFRSFLSMYILSFLAMDIIMAVTIYYMTYYLNRGGETNIITGVLLIAQIVGIPFFSMMAKKSGKRASFVYTSIAWMVVSFAGFFITPAMSFLVLYFYAAVLGFVTGGTVIAVFSIMPDIPDVDELFSGQRREGVFSGITMFVRKLSSAIGLFLVSSLIQLAGYVPPVKETADGITKMINQHQTSLFLLVIRIIFALIPVVLLLISLYGASKYGLTQPMHKKLRGYLDRKGGKALPEHTAEEISEAELNEMRLVLGGKRFTGNSDKQDDGSEQR